MRPPIIHVSHIFMIVYVCVCVFNVCVCVCVCVCVDCCVRSQLSFQMHCISILHRKSIFRAQGFVTKNVECLWSC